MPYPIQGFTGSNGFSEVAVDRLGSPGLRINITIAAKNDPPTVKLPSDFSAVEDVPMHVDGLEVQDVDVDEVRCFFRLMIFHSGSLKVGER